MGKLTEYFKYLEVKPNKLQELKDELFYINITKEMKKQRRKLKLYKNK